MDHHVAHASSLMVISEAAVRCASNDLRYQWMLNICGPLVMLTVHLILLMKVMLLHVHMYALVKRCECTSMYVLRPAKESKETSLQASH